jgi:hypothetical protein
MQYAEEFRRVFGFDKPNEWKEIHDPDDRGIYGVAAYGEWEPAEHPGVFEWWYEVGSFDYCYGFYCGVFERALATGFYEMADVNINETYPIALIGLIRMTPGRNAWRYGRVEGEIMHVIATFEPDNWDIPSVNFKNR